MRKLDELIEAAREINPNTLNQAFLNLDSMGKQGRTLIMDFQNQYHMVYEAIKVLGN